jgi:hypothetical protein
MDTTNPRCLQLPPRIALTCAVALKTIKYCAHCLINVSPNRLYIKLQSLLRTKLPIDLPKHMSALLKTRSKQDLNHKASFNSFDKRNATELSKYVWELKNRNSHYTIKWKLLKRAKPYNCASNRCNLCLWEKYFIICKPKMATLNKRNELVSACRC